MILRGASALYGAAASWRRGWYARDPRRRRRLARPVVSVGNLSTGGRGKTPVVAAIAALLQEHGARPAILSRGYARRHRPEGVTVVSDGSNVRSGVEAAGDEPLMLARAMPGVPVLVAADRYAAGRLAESRLGVDLHVLDDGFQHLALARDIDLVLVDDVDFDDRVLPAGRLRERLATLRLADAVLFPSDAASVPQRVSAVAPDVPLFTVRRALGAAVWIGLAPGEQPQASQPVFAIAGVAQPDRFFGDLEAAGWRVAGTMAFRDHHWFAASDVSRVVSAARAAGADAIVTTDKDAVRLECHAFDLPLARVPLSVAVEPPAFEEWLRARVDQARSGQS